MRSIRCCLSWFGLFTWLAVVAPPAFATCGDNWQWANPLPQGNSLNAVAYGNGKFVAVGNYGTIMTTADEMNWTIRTSGTTDRLNGISYGNNQWVAVGGYYGDHHIDNVSTILTSPDGITWTTRTSGTTNWLRAISYGNNQWVAVGGNGSILVSPDGITWTTRTSGTTNSLYGISYGNNQWVAMGYWGTILTSADGITWTTRTSGTTNYFNGISYGNNQWVVVGWGILTSPDGITWTNRNSGTAHYFNGISYGNNQWVAVGDFGIILISPDGITWTTRSSGTDNGLNATSYGNNQWVAVGEYGSILTSPDGITWTPHTSGTTNRLEDINYGNNQWVAVGEDGSILTSPDGITWTPRTSGTTGWLNAISYGNNQWIAVGHYDTILTSPDGIAWTTRTSGTTSELEAISYANNQWVAVGGTWNNGSIFTSQDGITWTPRTSGTTNYLNDISYGNNQWIIVGGDISDTDILTSPDGITWTPRNAGTTDLFLGISYGNNQWITVGTGGSILTSSDGITWTKRTSNNGLLDISYGNNQWVAVGEDGSILTSPDGITWTPRTSGTDNRFRAISYANNQWVAVGGYGTILTSQCAVPTFPLNIYKNGSGQGTVTSTPAGINCGTDCNETYPSTTSITLTPTPSSGSIFSNWSGDCTGTNPTCTITMDAAKTATATFNSTVLEPTVTTTAASNITQTSVTLNGTVISSNATATVSFDVGTTTAYGTNVAATPAQVYSSSAVAVSVNKTDLSCNTTYHYRLQAVNSAGTSYGTNQSFTTAACIDDNFPANGQMPTGWTTPATSNASWRVVTDATNRGPYSLRSGVIGNSAISQIQVSGNFQAGNITFARKVSSESGYDFLKFYLDGSEKNKWSGDLAWATVNYTLTAGTHTLLWTYAKDGSAAVGSDAAWIDSVTLPPLVAATIPTAVTNAATNITSIGAILNGNVTSNGAATTVTFDFGPTTAYGTTSAATPAQVYSASAVAVSATKTALTCGTTYHFRTKAVNSAGTSYGLDQSFTTSACIVNGVCGSANGSTVTVAPTANLCNSGTASAVTGTGPWTWTCNGANGGTTATCSANIATYTVTATAGSGGSVTPSTRNVTHAATTTFTVTANSGYSINNAVTGTCPGNWNNGSTSSPSVWTTGAITANCTVNFSFTPIVNGVCGTANGSTVTAAPTTNLCSSGTATAVTGTGPWNWNCNGQNGGSNATCSANIATYTVTPSAGTGGTVSPNTAQTVNYGVTTSFTVSANSSYSINNVVTGTCPGNWNSGSTSSPSVWTTGAITANCSVNFSFTPIVNGVCGTANGSTVTAAPTANLCSQGTASAVSGTGPWTWTCNGQNGGSNANCTANLSVPSYTVTASANPVAGGSFVPEIAQSVTTGTTTSFTVIPATNSGGYVTNPVVTGTCPLGSWGGTWNNIWTTGPITANCTVIFGFTAVNTWAAPPNQTVTHSTPFTLDVTVKSNGTKVGQYNFVVTFDPTKLKLDTTYQNATGLCKSGVCPGSNALANPAPPLVDVNTIVLTGYDSVGIGPGNDLQLLVIHFISRYVMEAPSFVTPVALKTNFLATIYGDNIGLGARSANVNVSTGLCGDADGNTSVNIVDALAIARKVVGMPPPPTVEDVLADVNEDGRVAITDALHIARYAVGLLTPPEVCAIGQAFTNVLPLRGKRL